MGRHSLIAALSELIRFWAKADFIAGGQMPGTSCHFYAAYTAQSYPMVSDHRIFEDFGRKCSSLAH